MTKKDNASRMCKLVMEFEESGQSQKEFSAAHGIKQGKLYYWISKLTKQQQGVSSSSVSENNFVPITLTSEEEQEIRSIIIRCTSGVEIEIPL